jgi:hypothetical protein
MIEPLVTKTCSSFNQVVCSISDLNTERTLLKLLMELKKFTKFGTSLCPPKMVSKIGMFHHWFIVGVQHWLDIEVFGAKIRCLRLD